MPNIARHLCRLNIAAYNPSGGGGSPLPPPNLEEAFFGQRAVATPGDGGETGFSVFHPVIGQTAEVQFFPLLANNFLHIRVPTAFEIATIRQLFLGAPGQDVLSDWVKTEDYGLIGGASYDSYTRGPINPEAAGQDIDYLLTFTAGA